MSDKHKMTIHQTPGTKTVLVVRHAKSSWDLGSLNDFERPLNERGKKDAPAMAKRMLDRSIMIDAFVSSPAKRAKKTAEYFCETFDKSADDIIFISMLYHETAEDIYAAIESMDDSLNTVAVFTHNPGISTFVNTLTDEIQIDSMPTCGVFAVQTRIEKWTDFKKSNKQFLFFDYPKKV